MDYVFFIFRILLSVALGFFIGLERQLTGHIAGIRINVLICMGTCFFTLFPLICGSDQVFRVGSSIISGVGFLCSCVIFKDKGLVRGMNTAGTLWCTASIGILATIDSIWWSVIATLILILSNLILRPIARKIKPVCGMDESEREYKISVVCGEEHEPKMRQFIINNNFSKTLFLKNLQSGDVVGNKVEIIAEFSSIGKPKEKILENFVGKILKMPDVISAGWEIV